MLRVEFISTEDEEDLIVSFALMPAAERSLTLLRSPNHEHLLEPFERGVSISGLERQDLERDLLRSVQWTDGTVTVKTARHEYHLDVSAVPEEEVAAAKATLRRMVKDGTALFRAA